MTIEQNRKRKGYVGFLPRIACGSVVFDCYPTQMYPVFIAACQNLLLVEKYGYFGADSWHKNHYF